MATFLILSILPTEVPPNFKTIVFIDNYNYFIFDKIHLNCYVHKRSIMNSINKKEIEKFSRIAEEWWNPNGKFKPLHNFNPIRIKYIKDNIVKDFNIKTSSKPFKNIKILDIGCGGGLLSEPMSRLGASVVGIDASEKNIKVAKFHAKKIGLKLIIR